MNRFLKWTFPVFVGVIVALFADNAWAWGPATHLHYGMQVLDRLNEIIPAVRAVLAASPIEFLYGCVSADIVLAKKLGRAMTHCHRWDNGIRLIEEAKSNRIKAFSIGYVSHLAADTISHNCYVPSKTIESYDSGVLKHMYWELRFDQKVTNRKTLDLFQEIARGDFSDCDAHLEALVPTRIFDFSTNKKIFNQLLVLQGMHRWQRLWASIQKSASWPLADLQVKQFADRSMQAIMSFLNEEKDSRFIQADPIGQHRLKAAHAVRRHFLRRLRDNRAPSALTVKKVVDRFAREPFTRIQLRELKAA